MGCSDDIGLKEIDENHKTFLILESEKFQKNSKIDFSKNNNKYITSCSHYFKNENIPRT